MPIINIKKTEINKLDQNFNTILKILQEIDTPLQNSQSKETLSN